MLPDEIFAYVNRPDRAYQWRTVGLERRDKTTIYTLQLTSQTWLSGDWNHTLRLFVPDGSTSETVLLYVEMPYYESDYEVQQGIFTAQATGIPCAFLYDIPNQPLFEGLDEDALISYTLQQYLDTADSDWPLLFPMVKSAVRAMDAIEAFGETVQANWKQFVVSGMSKRGWTSWLAPVVDSRVVAIIPMVYDNLNLAAQMPHQVEAFGTYSERIHDYTDRDLPAQLNSERGRYLGYLIDPYTYREKLTVPKLLVHGSNDPYWATDAVNFYWNDLSGTKYLLDVPNAGHGLPDAERLFGTSVAFLKAIAAGQLLPEWSWEYTEKDRAVSLTLSGDASLTKATLWLADAENQDFRLAEWIAMPMLRGASDFHFEVEKTTSGYRALFGEASFSTPFGDYTLTTTPRIVGNLR